MTSGARDRYNRDVRIAWRAVAIWIVAFVLLAGAHARADTETIVTKGAPVIYVQMQQGRVTIRTWAHSTVHIDGDPGISVRHVPNIRIHALPPITFFAQTIQTASGPLTLQPEPFVAPPFDPAGHDLVAVTGHGRVTMTIPAATPVIVARVARGAITLVGYHGGTFVTQMIGGIVRLRDVSGTGGIQVNNGPVVAANSTFDRLRVRTGRGNMFFEHCVARQIEATSLLGTIVYDNGRFQPGLARFESDRGSVALGVRGGAQILAHAQSGRVISEGTIASGPTVTATSTHGNVIYFNGTLRAHPSLVRRLKPNARTLRFKRRRCCRGKPRG